MWGFFVGLHSLKPTVRQWKQAIPKGNSSSNHPFSGACAVSFRGYSNFRMISKSMRRRLCCVWRDIPDWCAFPPNQIHQNHPKNAGLHPSPLVTKNMLDWMRFLRKNQLKLISANRWNVKTSGGLDSKILPKLSDSRLRTIYFTCKMACGNHPPGHWHDFRLTSFATPVFSEP